MPLNFRQLQNLSRIVKGVEAGRIPPSVATKALSQSAEGAQALQVLMGIGAQKGLDVFDRAPGALAKVGAYSRYDVPSMGAPELGATFSAGPRFQEVPRIVERPSAIVPSPGGAADYPGYTRRTAQELLSERLGALPGGQRSIGISTRGVAEDQPGLGFASQPNVTRGVRVDTGLPESAAGRAPAGYRYTDVGAGVPGGLAVRPSVAAGGGSMPPIDVEFTDLPPAGKLALRGPVYTEGTGIYGKYTRHPDVLGERRAAMQPGTIPFDESVLQKVAKELGESAISGGTQQGDLGSVLRTLGIGTGVGLGTALLTRLLGIGRPSESAAPGQINQGAAAPGTVTQPAPPSAIPTGSQRAGGVEQAPGSPAPKSPAGQVVIETPGDIDERLREQLQQYGGKKGPGAQAPAGGKLPKFYAEQEAFGRANIDMIVNDLGLTGNLEVWARSNPLNAAQLYLRSAAKQQQATDLNQRTEFTAPQEIQPRGLSQQTMAVQGQMINSQLGSDFERNRMGNINLSTEAAVNPSQGTYDLRDATTPLAQPTLMNPDAVAQQEEARRQQMREFIFQSAAAGKPFI
jgi:hypothetical protein